MMFKTRKFHIKEPYWVNETTLNHNFNSKTKYISLKKEKFFIANCPVLEHVKKDSLNKVVTMVVTVDDNNYYGKYGSDVIIIPIQSPYISIIHEE